MSRKLIAALGVVALSGAACNNEAGTEFDFIYELTG